MSERISINDVFLKPTGRYIDSVVKADDEGRLRQELEEYVLTDEVTAHLKRFLAAYVNPQGGSGVWISGFFGAGKSHLLKVLSVLLEDRPVDDTTAAQIILPKCRDAALKSALKKALAIPARSILFNIDQKANTAAATPADNTANSAISTGAAEAAGVNSTAASNRDGALPAVFAQVFDEMCGYYGRQPHIARLERQLDKDGHYAEFRRAFEHSYGQPWTAARQKAQLVAGHVATALSAVTGEPAERYANILNELRADYRLSIEDFAEQVNAWIEQQMALAGSEDYRLNFCVDEVGQFIADNPRLMINLQTVAESLATACHGRARIIVTAQDNLDDMVGGHTGAQPGTRTGTPDFSKIRARFSVRIKLSDTDVAEVIQKRLLEKTPRASALLADVYRTQVNNLKTIFTFTDDSVPLSGIGDEARFIATYPFMPYQYELFRLVIHGLAANNAFEGQFNSVGARSMLGVFQDVLQTMTRDSADHPAIDAIDTLAALDSPDTLAPFDRLYEGLKPNLRAAITATLDHAAQSLHNPCAVRLLKTLCLLKYVPAFRANPRNLAILMTDSLTANRAELRRQVDEALFLLERTGYIRRRGDRFEFLTPPEKEVEQEIKNTHPEPAALTAQLAEFLFGDLTAVAKMRHTESGRDFYYVRKLDETAYGRDRELSVHVLSPFCDKARREALRAANMGKKELLILLKEDETLTRELYQYVSTESYIIRNIFAPQRADITAILHEIEDANIQRKTELHALIRQLMEESVYLVNGAELKPAARGLKSRLPAAFNELVSRVYPNLGMVGHARLTEKDIPRLPAPYHGADAPSNTADAPSNAEAAAPSPFPEAELEVFALLQRRQASGDPITLHQLLDTLTCAPYGWTRAAALCVIAGLTARGKAEPRLHDDLLSPQDWEELLTERTPSLNPTLTPRAHYSTAQIRALKEFLTDFFDVTATSHDPLELARLAQSNFSHLITEVKALLRERHRYPFLQVLEPALCALQNCAERPDDWYLTQLPALSDELLDLKDNVLTPVTDFMRGNPAARNIYAAAAQLVTAHDPQAAFFEPNCTEWAQIKTILADPHCYLGNKMNRLKTLTEAARLKIEEALNAARHAAAQRLNLLRNRLLNVEFDDKSIAEINAEFDAALSAPEREDSFLAIRYAADQFEQTRYPALLARLRAVTGDAASPADFIPRAQITPDFNRPWLSNDADVEQYLCALRTALTDQIKQGKQITL